MRLAIKTFQFLLVVALLTSCKNRQDSLVTDRLPRSIPEIEGVDSKGITNFLKAVESSKNEFHSFMFLRHGKVIAEGWWSPYSPDLKHTLYSASKSFTSTAVGFAVTEKYLKVTDKVISFFPESLPDTVSANLADMEVRDLLTMSAGLQPDPTGLITTRETDWVRAFLKRPVVNDPGTKFLYNSMATYMLSAIVQKVTGQKVIEYLTPRLFEPLGIKGTDWETDPSGINTGGWGLRLKTEDLAKFGQLYLMKGKWNGKQILSEAWINEATSPKIDQAPGIADSIKKENDWMQGYCYQFWRCRNNAFRADGAFGQYIIVFPEKDAVVAITGETQNMQDELDLVWEYLLPSLMDKPLPENNEAYTSLKQNLSSLSIKLPEEGSVPGKILSNKTFVFAQNDRNIHSIALRSDSEYVFLKLNAGGRDYDFTFGGRSWAKDSTTWPGPNLLLKAKNHLAGIPPVQTAGIYRWLNDRELELTLRYIESPHTLKLNCMFEENKMILNMKYSLAPGYDLPELTGSVFRP